MAERLSWKQGWAFPSQPDNSKHITPGHVGKMIKTNRRAMDSSPTATQVRNNCLAADTRPANRADLARARIPEPADLPPEQRPGDVPEAQITDDNETYSPVFDEDGNQLDTTRTERILELNKAAADYFACNYSTDPAAYIASRFGSDLKNDPRFNIDYAPPGWDNLTRRLQTTMNASKDELVDAGLAKYSSRGTLIDVFRDRVTIAMSDGDKILGFTGRANPADKRAPKYLNTPATKVCG